MRFRRILCGFMGDMVGDGRYPYDEKPLRTLAEDISYNNAVRYFGITKG